MRVVFYRHGQTEGNLKKQYIGSTDQPLCPQGIAAARAVGADEQVEKVYTSPLLRTLQTAKILFPNAQPQPLSSLAEMDFGAFEGKSYRDLDGDAQYQSWVDSGCEAAVPGGEDQAGFIRRVCASFEHVVNRELEQGTSQLYFVVHSGTIMAIMSRYAHSARPYFDWWQPNCEARHVYIDKDLWLSKKQLFVLGEE